MLSADRSVDAGQFLGLSDVIRDSTPLARATSFTLGR
jgi:hypothetical protein